MPDANPVDALVGARLRERRLQQGLPLNALSLQTGVGSARLLRFEKGLERVPAAIMVKLCGVLRFAPLISSRRLRVRRETRLASSGCRRRL